jgi:phosphoglycolate phosphatase-like HAD superfamily hydrolase
VKPNPGILLSIIADLGGTVGEVVYVGDNILKDVYMAQQAGVTDVHEIRILYVEKPAVLDEFRW